jgi:hypothetical protein
MEALVPGSGERLNTCLKVGRAGALKSRVWFAVNDGKK